MLLRETERNILRLTQESLNRDSNHQLLKQLLQLEEAQFGRNDQDVSDWKMEKDYQRKVKVGEDATKEGEDNQDYENNLEKSSTEKSTSSPANQNVPTTRTSEDQKERTESGKSEL